MTSPCRLCHGETFLFFEAVKPFEARYERCLRCELVQMEKSRLLEPEEEKNKYLIHENSKRDPGYIEFLYQCLGPTLNYLKSGNKGLDFGCGPYPMAAELMREEGYEMDCYDPHFYPSPQSLNKTYAFVIATEVVEHFNNPAAAWSKLRRLVEKNGVLSIRTSFLYPHVDFLGWHYRRDMTHVCFYSPKTLRWLAKNFNLQILEELKNVAVFKKL
ncbi:MAG: class I SAM-dependent methyltransferase [Bacteriovoracaceae bacterium]